MGKDRGKGKRGGGKLFIENEEEMALRDASLQRNAEERMKRRQEADSDEEDGADTDDEGGKVVYIKNIYTIF